MIGEIRDFETAQIAIQASLTGHLVLATLHTNDAPSAVTRLTDMGVEPFLLSVVAARRARAAPGAQAVRALQAPGRARRWHPVGCAECGMTGYKGRTGVYELMVADDEIRADPQPRRRVAPVRSRQAGGMRLDARRRRTAGGRRHHLARRSAAGHARLAPSCAQQSLVPLKVENVASAPDTAKASTASFSRRASSIPPGSPSGRASSPGWWGRPAARARADRLGRRSRGSAPA
jgi:hypothetical protein